MNREKISSVPLIKGDDVLKPRISARLRTFFVFVLWVVAAGRLEIHLSVVVAALQQLFHFFLAWLARVGAGAGVQEGIC